jgi:uracil-DNA glycosylase
MDQPPKNLKLPQFMDRVRGCAVCTDALPEGARPLLQAGRSAGIMVIGQAPGRRAHESGIPWDDASGQRLREWLGLSTEQFYDPNTVALMPMGFCYPGTGKSGDLPPRPECAPLWHDALLSRLPSIRLTVLIGQYAINHYTDQYYRTLTDAVRDHAALLPDRIALPHPSPRNNRWLAKHPWFKEEVLPKLRKRVGMICS